MHSNLYDVCFHIAAVSLIAIAYFHFLFYLYFLNFLHSFIMTVFSSV